MHVPEHFRETRREALDALMHAYPFATVVTNAADGLVGNYLPFEREGDVLQGHVARANELARLDGAKVLVIFRGPHAYVSPNWYPTTHETGREVPTWDYAVVHVHGRLKVVDDPVWLRAQLERLTNHHESTERQPWHVGDAPADHIAASLRAIVGIAIPIERIEGSFKLSQNHPERNRRGVIAGLRHRDGDGDVELADLMIRQEASRS